VLAQPPCCRTGESTPAMLRTFSRSTQDHPGLEAGLTPKSHRAQQPMVALRGSFCLRLAWTEDHPVAGRIPQPQTQANLGRVYARISRINRAVFPKMTGGDVPRRYAEVRPQRELERRRQEGTL